MNCDFIKKNFEEFSKEIDEIISLNLTEFEIKNLTLAIAKTKNNNLSENDVLNALEHLKKDYMRCILWKSVLNGFVNLEISEDGSKISFIPD